MEYQSYLTVKAKVKINDSFRIGWANHERIAQIHCHNNKAAEPGGHREDRPNGQSHGSYPQHAHVSFITVSNSVADPDRVFLGQPDPDPGKKRIRIGILYPLKNSCNSNFFVK